VIFPSPNLRLTPYPFSLSKTAVLERAATPCFAWHHGKASLCLWDATAVQIHPGIMKRRRIQSCRRLRWILEAQSLECRRITPSRWRIHRVSLEQRKTTRPPPLTSCTMSTRRERQRLLRAQMHGRQGHSSLKNPHTEGVQCSCD